MLGRDVRNLSTIAPDGFVECGCYASAAMSKTRYYQPSPFRPLGDPLSDTPADDPIERGDEYDLNRLDALPG
jgi:hypothetical protein